MIDTPGVFVATRTLYLGREGTVENWRSIHKTPEGARATLARHKDLPRPIPPLSEWKRAGDVWTFALTAVEDATIEGVELLP